MLIAAVYSPVLNCSSLFVCRSAKTQLLSLLLKHKEVHKGGGEGGKSLIEEIKPYSVFVLCVLLVFEQVDKKI